MAIVAGHPHSRPALLAVAVACVAAAAAAGLES
jgi:hypothetical protein